VLKTAKLRVKVYWAYKSMIQFYLNILFKMFFSPLLNNLGLDCDANCVYVVTQRVHYCF